jgi:hypothetical protein
MSIKVTVKPKKAVVSSVNIGPKTRITLEQITNIDASGAEDGEVLVYNAATNSYIVKPVIVDSNNIINLNGGSF